MKKSKTLKMRKKHWHIKREKFPLFYVIIIFLKKISIFIIRNPITEKKTKYFNACRHNILSSTTTTMSLFFSVIRLLLLILILLLVLLLLTDIANMIILCKQIELKLLLFVQL